jgi:hypothetical protein
MTFRNKGCVLLAWLSLGIAVEKSNAQSIWLEALAQMPLEPGVSELTRSNCVAVLLRAFRSNDLVKALVFMPGATDEFYMFRRARAVITNSAPTLADAVHALTNQTSIRATFRPPLLLLHADEDWLEPIVRIQHQPTFDSLGRTHAPAHLLLNDRDWDFLQPILKHSLKLDLRPWRYSPASWHFYRHSFAGWNLNGQEALAAAALAGKTGFVVRRREVVFAPDRRPGNQRPLRPQLN